MAKLSQFQRLIGAYIQTNGDKDVTSIANVSGSDEEYILNLHDIHKGGIGSNPYTGKDEIKIMKDNVWDMKPGSRLENTEIPKMDDKELGVQALKAYQKLEKQLSGQDGKPVYERMAALYGASTVLEQMGLVNKATLDSIWNDFAVRLLGLK